MACLKLHLHFSCNPELDDEVEKNLQIGTLTIHNGTNDLMNLAMEGRVTRKARRGSSQASRDCWSEGAP